MRALALLLLGGCAEGVLRFPEGHDAVRAAFVTTYTLPTGGTEVLGLVANSDLACTLPESDDPAVLQEALIRQAAGVSREGARVFLFAVYPTGDDWVATYEITADAAPGRIWSTPGVAGASWLAVLEAEVDSANGLSVGYTPSAEPGSFIFDPAVEGPGEIEVERWDGETLALRFQLDTIDVSGDARATYCEPDAALFATLGFAP